MPTQSKLATHRGDPTTRTHTKPQMQGLILANLNIQGLQNRLTQLSQVLINPEKDKIDILALTETWENHDNSSDYSMLKGYKYIGKPNSKTSRGVGFLISNKISH